MKPDLVGTVYVAGVTVVEIVVVEGYTVVRTVWVVYDKIRDDFNARD